MGLDKFYTKPEVAKECYDFLISKYDIKDKKFLEPSAGNGSFLPFLKDYIALDIKPEKVREVIGSGGKTINSIIDKTGVKIDIQDNGHITVSAANEESGREAIKMIEYIVIEPEVGDVYLGKVARIMNFGAFVEFANGKEGLVHISQIDHQRVNKVEDVLNIGDEVMIKVMEIDEKGRINLSRKALLPRGER